MVITTPIGILEVNRRAKNGFAPEPSQPIFGGYANGHGEISLFGENAVFRVNFKNKTIQPRPGLNPDAQACYDRVKGGETFEYCSKSFLRLSDEQILEICASGAFRITPKYA
jgi:hypothetical protein